MQTWDIYFLFFYRVILLIPALGPGVDWIQQRDWMLTCEIRETEIWGQYGVRNKNVTLFWSSQAFCDPVQPHLCRYSSKYVLLPTFPFFEEKSIFLFLFMWNFLKQDIQMGFLPYILSAESSGPHHANQTGCHSVSHFVQFHVLSSWKEENYFDRLKPFPYWNGRFVSFLSALVHCLLMPPR